MTGKAIQATWWGVSPTSTKRKHTLAECKAEFARFRKLSKKHGGLVQSAAVAMALGVSRQRVNQLVNEGRLPSYTVFDRLVIPADAVAARLNESGD